MEKVDAAEAVKRAKDAVEGLDEPYKMEAFKLVLSRLMSGATPNAEGHAQERQKSVPKRAVRRKATPSSASVEKPKQATTLDLSIKQLEQLKEFYSRVEVKGGELCAFVLCAFLQTELKRQRFNEADVTYCYRQLISLKVPVPAVKDFYQPLVWLVAPSRKKEWLRKTNDGQFELTNSGLIALNNLPKKAKAG